MQIHELTPLVESLLFVADQPLSVNALVRAVGEDGVTALEVRRSLEALTQTYESQRRGFHLVKLGNGYQIVTRPEFEPWVRGMLAGKQKARLSRAALETVAVVAYKQPITRLDVEGIRGVDVGGVLNTLLERGLIMIRGRDNGPGRPLLYGTTQGFLDYFGLSKLTDLPRMDEIAALAKAETASIWDDTELARFEKHGVDPAAEEEAEDPEAAGEEADAPDDVQASGEASSEEESPAEEPEEGEREEFQQVASGFADHAVEEGEPAPSPQPDTTP